MKVALESVISADGGISSVDPLGKRNSQPADAALVTAGITMMEPHHLAQHGDVGDVSVGHLPRDARFIAEVPLERLIHEPLVAGGVAIACLHFLGSSSMVAVACRHNDSLKVAMLKQVTHTGDNRPLAFNQLLGGTQLLLLYLFRMQPVVDQVTAKPDDHLVNGDA